MAEARGRTETHEWLVADMQRRVNHDPNSHRLPELPTVTDAIGTDSNEEQAMSIFRAEPRSLLSATNGAIGHGTRPCCHSVSPRCRSFAALSPLASAIIRAQVDCRKSRIKCWFYGFRPSSSQSTLLGRPLVLLRVIGLEQQHHGGER